MLLQDASVRNLEAQTADMKKQFKTEEKDSKMSSASAEVGKMLELYSRKKAKEDGREKVAEDKAHAARVSARHKQADALRLQARADLIQKELVSMGCTFGGKGVDGTKCDASKKVSLDNEYSALKSQIKVLEQEVLYEHKQASVMSATARLQQKMASTDGYKALVYRKKLEGSQKRLSDLRKDLIAAPEQIKAAQLNLKLAAQAAERVQERLQIIREKQRTDFAQESKAKALERLQVLSLSFAP
jgi:hypothetical protein